MKPKWGGGGRRNFTWPIPLLTSSSTRCCRRSSWFLRNARSLSLGRESYGKGEASFNTDPTPSPCLHLSEAGGSGWGEPEKSLPEMTVVKEEKH